MNRQIDADEVLSLISVLIVSPPSWYSPDQVKARRHGLEVLRAFVIDKVTDQPTFREIEAAS